MTFPARSSATIVFPSRISPDAARRSASAIGIRTVAISS
jgi:hypothetical protein